jgi:hypothetical protein
MRTAIALPVVRGQGLAGGGKMQVARTYTLVFLGLMVLGCGAVAPVAEAGEKLRVGISPFAPCVMFTEKGPEGAAIAPPQRLQTGRPEALAPGNP